MEKELKKVFGQYSEFFPYLFIQLEVDFFFHLR